MATSSSKETYDLKVFNHQKLFELLPYKIWGSSDPTVKKGKPHPDVFHVAAAKFPDHPEPEKVIQDEIFQLNIVKFVGIKILHNVQ